MSAPSRLTVLAGPTAVGKGTVAAYVREPGATAYEPLAIDVLRVQDGAIVEIVTFDRAVFRHFGLPATLDAPPGAAGTTGPSSP